MNSVVFSFLLSLPLSFAHLNNYNINFAPAGFVEKQPVTKEVKAFSTDWESPSTWKTKHEGNLVAYYFERETPELNKNSLAGGTVAVFARGVNDDVYNAQDKPLSLPLYLFPVQENVQGIIEYKFASLQGKVQMVIQMQQDMENIFNEQKKQLQFRYFFLPDGLLIEHKISKEEAKKLSYNRIVELLESAA